eukprot:CAMPEP_0172428684 /NCGR_PEP_ID=MMETSP1064-20121228/47363_1 /TAXON_ID=202472 /ORGANISM="Aulacoseira subarctica , Strain CCAP 1002/5" /LENGTH=273 /DNA_ID=CAMNT_0013173591 /DNA_START=54 /DNA_END=875 /DNA_ORIENTATION=-
MSVIIEQRPPIPPCKNWLCSNPGVKKCTRCRYARYCSRECQLEHFKEHKSYCKKLAVPENIVRLHHANHMKEEGSTLMKSGRLDEAIYKQREALHIFRELLGENDTHTAFTCGDMGDALRQKDKYEEALVEFRKVLDIYRKVFGENHILAANTYDNIGHVLLAQGRVDDSLIGYGKALSIRINLFGENHEDTAQSYMFLGGVLSKKKQNKEALEKLCKAEAIYKRDLGKLDPLTVDLTETIDYIATAYQHHKEMDNFESVAQFWRKKFSSDYN